MAVWKYPEEVHEFVKKWCTRLRDGELAEKCNRTLGTSFTKKSMRSFRHNHGYKNHMGRLSSEEYWERQTRYPKGMLEYIRENSWGVSSKEMAERVNARFGTDFTQNTMKMFRQRHGIKSGVKGWFQKVHPPGNKGKKQSEYCSPEAIERSARTHFKPGHVPANLFPVGVIVVSSDGYKLRKKQISGSQWERWEFLHRAVWEEHNGPIPDGMIVTFRDGDRLNCDIGNLVLISRAEYATMVNKGYRKTRKPEIFDLGLATVRLMRAAKDARERRKKNGRDDT